MKRYSNFYKALSFVIALCTLFSLFSTIGIYAYDEDEAEEVSDSSEIIETDESSYSACYGASEKTFYMDLNNKLHFDSDEIITVTYIAGFSEEIVNFSYTTNGFTVVSALKDEEDRSKINLELKCNEGYESCTLEITAVFSDQEILTSVLYAVNTEYGVFLSQHSEENAVKNYWSYMLDEDIISQNEYDELKNQYASRGTTTTIQSIPLEASNSGISTYATSVGAGDTCVWVHLTWTDNTGKSHALREATIEIYDHDVASEELLAEVSTNDSGNAYFYFNNPDGIFDFENGGYDIYIVVYAKSERRNVAVYGSDNAILKSKTEPPIENIKTGETLVISHNIDMSTETGQGFQIFQAINSAAIFTYAMMGGAPPAVTVKYPSNDHPICAYNYQTQKIHINNNSKLNPNLFAYESWELLMHEYGHHIARYFGIDASPGGNHDIDDNLAETNNSKSKGILLTWAESWASVFALIAQDYLDDYISTVPYCCDTIFDSSLLKTSYNINTWVPGVSDKYGETCELSVMAVLWDLYDGDYDSYSDGTEDVICLSYNWWDDTTQSAATSFNSFIQHYYSLYPTKQNKLQLGDLLEIYGISPEFNTSFTAAGTASTPPQIVWYAGGDGDIDTNGDGTLETSLKNNAFNIVIYNQSGTVVFSKEVSNATNYTLSSTEWTNVRNSCSTSYTICVGGKNTVAPTTGYYYSGGITFSVP